MTALAWPALMENLLATLVQFVNTAMVGGLGAAAIATVAINTTPMWLVNGLVTAVGVGGTALVARMIGAGDREGAEAACRQVFLLIVGFSVFLTGVMFLLSGAIPALMGAEESLHRPSAEYMRIIAMGFVPHFTGMALGAVLRGAGDTKTPLYAAAGANLLNLVGNYLLIYASRDVQILGWSVPMWGAGLGVTGAAISTAVSTALAGLCMVFLICRPKSRLRLRLGNLRPDGAILRRILRVGVPTAMERVTINVGQLFFAALITSIGTAELAAHHLSVTVESLSYMPGFAFGVAATTLVGQALGAGDAAKAKAQGWLTIRSSIWVMSLIGVGMFLFAPALIGMLTPDEAVRAIGTSLIRICSVEQPFMALSIVGTSALRGAGDTRVPLYISLVGMWGVRLVLAWILAFHFGLGVQGAWYAMVTDLAVRSALIVVRFARGKWTRVRV